MEKIQIKHRYTQQVLFETEAETILDCLKKAREAGADLSYADLCYADLRNADLRGAKEIPSLVAARSLIVPEGTLIGWKKCRDDVIVKLRVPESARRSNSTTRKCRSRFVEVIEVHGADIGISKHDGVTKYVVGETTYCAHWEEDRWIECGGDFTSS